MPWACATDKGAVAAKWEGTRGAQQTATHCSQVDHCWARPCLLWDPILTSEKVGYCDVQGLGISKVPSTLKILQPLIERNFVLFLMNMSALNRHPQQLLVSSMLHVVFESVSLTLSEVTKGEKVTLLNPPL